MTRLFVGNLPYKLDERGLIDAFAELNVQISNVRIPLDRTTGQPRGFGFIEVADGTGEQVKRLADRMVVQGRTIRVDDATERPSSPRNPNAPRPAPGGNGGQRGVEARSYESTWKSADDRRAEGGPRRRQAPRAARRQDRFDD